MKLLEMSDSQILEVAEPILNDIVTGSNNKDWEQFSRYMSKKHINNCLLYTSPSPRDKRQSRMPSSA